MIIIPSSLRNSFENQNCVLFVGAGVGCHFKSPNGTTAPNGKELCNTLAKNFSIVPQVNSTLAQIAEIVEMRKGRKELEAFIHTKLSDLTPDETFQWITTVRWNAIFTTNYDNCIERAYEISPKPVQKPISYSYSADLRSIQPYYDVPIFHLHGSFLSNDDPNIIITRSDYAKFRQKRKMLFDILKKEFATSTILYIGYSNQDSNWDILLEETIEDFLPSFLPQSYRLDPTAEDLDIEILQNKNIYTIKSTFADFVSDISPITSSLTSTPDALTNLKKQIPKALISHFEANPIPTSRLLNSWEYVNDSLISTAPSNLQNFLKGDPPNWTLISNNEFFHRDIQYDVYDALLDFATSIKSLPTLSIILGSAGYGISTLLRIFASELVKEGAGNVFLLRTGASILEGDIEYAVSVFDNVFFIIDDAADHSSSIAKCYHFLRESNKRAMFLLGEHLNEWHQRVDRPKGQEFLIEPLSDNEINRLLEFLTKQKSLNKLEDLPRDLQFAVIKDNHQKELLVVMREATENNSFDAIIESEYRGIGDDFSRQFYLIVCCFYQHGALIRDSLLAELLNIEIAELYKRTNTTTEGIISYECIDSFHGHYAARARHHKIAAVVWERCGEIGLKEDIISKTIKVLNLNYPVDVRAFDLFIKSERIVDCLRRIEDKMNFFEEANRKDPTSPYVKQHYARMLHRAKKYSLALNQIEGAIKDGSNVRILYHTQGKILSDLAIQEESVNMARKYLVQAEKSFRYGISLSNRDEYNIESLAALYFDWAKKFQDIDASEFTDYIYKAEETISLGLRSVRNREPLWVLSSKIHLYLGSTPKSISILENAIKEHSGSIVARFLLARSYRQKGMLDEALKILEPVIKSNKDEFRAFIEFSLALIELGEPYRKAKSILELSTLYGLSDPRFIATYGGFQYMDGDFTIADSIFQNAIKQGFPADEIYAIHFYPPDPHVPSNKLVLMGEVVSVQPGYSIILAEGFPKLICPASKYRGHILLKGSKVNFTLAFCAKGPVALYPTTIES